MNKRILYLLMAAVCLLGGCSERESDSMMEDGPVPIVFAAVQEDAAALSSTDTRALTEWDATLFASNTSKNYQSFDAENEWVKDATIAFADGEVTLLGDEVFYPNSGDWVYVVGVSPKATATDGKVVYTDVEGDVDLLYAKEVRGSKWKAEQFGSNKKLEFIRLYTQLTFWAKVGSNRESDNMKIKSIVLKNVKDKVEIVLGSGVITWSNPVDRDLGISETTIGTTLLNVTTAMLSPSATYTMEVETSAGTFSGVLTPKDNNAFLAGHSHKVTLSFSDTGLEDVTVVAVEQWQTENKDLNVN